MNLFPKVKAPYFIYTPSYTSKSSGVVTLHLLCHALNESGEKAFIISDNGNGFSTNPHLNTPVPDPQHINFYLAEGIEPIVVYPDIVRGNPLDAKKIVRYLLAPAGAYGGDKDFSETDNIWGALPSLAEKVLRIPVCDPDIFYQDYSNRSGTCFYSHKYDRIHGNALLDITKNSVRLEGTQDQIADILRASSVCYLYELSSVITEAALCGCPVTLIRTPYFSDIDTTCMMGDVEWDDTMKVKEFYGSYHDEYGKIVRDFEYDLQKFIKNTQEMK